MQGSLCSFTCRFNNQPSGNAVIDVLKNNLFRLWVQFNCLFS